MVLNVKNYLVFISSPNGLEREREAIVKEINHFNIENEKKNMIAFKPVSWDDVLPGKADPQERVNKQLDECDFYILLLYNKWGTKTKKYSSGTYEEYSRAKKLYEDKKANMNDLALLFKAIPSDLMRDRGEEVSKILMFKKELEDNRECCYKDYEAKENLDDFRFLIRRILNEWFSIIKDAESDEANEQCVKSYFHENKKTDVSSLYFSSNILDRFTHVIEDDKSESLIKAENYALEEKNSHAEEMYAEACKDQTNIWALVRYGRFLRKIGQKNKARDILIEAGELSKREYNSFYEAYTMHQLGKIFRANQDNNSARTKFKDALNLYKRSDDKIGLALVYSDLGICCKALHLYEDVELYYGKALSIFKNNSENYFYAKTNQLLSNYYRFRGQFKNAYHSIKTALDVFVCHKSNNIFEKNIEASCYYEHSILCRFMLDYEIALESLSKAQGIYRETNNSKMYERVEFEKALILKGQIKFTEAEVILNKQLRIVEKYGSSRDILVKNGAYISLCVERYVYNIENDISICETKNNFDDIVAKLSLHISFAKDSSDKRGLIIHYTNLGRMYKADENYEKAMEYFRKAVEFCINIDSKYEQYIAEKEIAKVLICLGSKTEGIMQLEIICNQFSNIGVEKQVLETKNLIESIQS